MYATEIDKQTGSKMADTVNMDMDGQTDINVDRHFRL